MIAKYIVYLKIASYDKSNLNQEFSGEIKTIHNFNMRKKIVCLKCKHVIIWL